MITKVEFQNLKENLIC